MTCRGDWKVDVLILNACCCASSNAVQITYDDYEQEGGEATSYLYIPTQPENFPGSKTVVIKAEQQCLHEGDAPFTGEVTATCAASAEITAHKNFTCKTCQDSESQQEH